MSAVATPAKRVPVDGLAGITLPPAVLAKEIHNSMHCLDIARMYLREARMRACNDYPVVCPIGIAVVALEEAIEAAVARRAALEAM
ncbi:hypothetical protein LJR129_002476 [Acidovorax sp. LjRoot129]|uniref:hypothetical protein n=1 Tax=Acidovorax sp. LjRoot129 TaxID=3342260 RepID=UPI003ECDD8BD